MNAQKNFTNMHKTLYRSEYGVAWVFPVANLARSILKHYRVLVRHFESQSGRRWRARLSEQVEGDREDQVTFHEGSQHSQHSDMEHCVKIDDSRDIPFQDPYLKVDHRLMERTSDPCESGVHETHRLRKRQRINT